MSDSVLEARDQLREDLLQATYVAAANMLSDPDVKEDYHSVATLALGHQETADLRANIKSLERSVAIERQRVTREREYTDNIMTLVRVMADVLNGKH